MLERTPCGVPQLRQKVGNKVQGRRSRRLDPFPEPASAPPSANALHPQTTSHQPPGQTRLRPVVRAEEPEGPSNEDLPGQLPQAHGVSKPTIGSSAAPPFLADTHRCHATRRQRLAICVRRKTTTQGRRSRHLGRCPFACLDLDAVVAPRSKLPHGKSRTPVRCATTLQWWPPVSSSAWCLAATAFPRRAPRPGGRGR